MSNNNNSNINRIPVVYKNQPLMPCTKNRAGYLCKINKAVFVYDKHLGWYLKLKVKPKTMYKQKLVLGVDTGTCFSGFSVANKNNSHNFEFESTRKIKDRNFIKKNSETRRINRLNKRCRLRHRKTRFNNRTSSKRFNSTENYYHQNHLNVVKWIIKLYPISDIAIEDVGYNHYISNKGSSFSPIEQIKPKLYENLSKFAKLHIIKGTYKWRLENGVDPKIKEIWRKGELSFYAHCIDSHALCRFVFNDLNLGYNTSFIYISRRLPKIDDIRRKLILFKNKRNSNFRSNSRLKKIRFKVNKSKSNHGPWRYSYTQIYKTKPHVIQLHGGSIYHSNEHGKVLGRNKYKTILGYQYYKLKFVS